MQGNEIQAQFKLYRKTQKDICEELSKRMGEKVYTSQLSAALNDNLGDGTKTRKILSECERMIEEWKGERA